MKFINEKFILVMTLKKDFSKHSCNSGHCEEHLSLFFI